MKSSESSQWPSENEPQDPNSWDPLGSLGRVTRGWTESDLSGAQDPAVFAMRPALPLPAHTSPVALLLAQRHYSSTSATPGGARPGVCQCWALCAPWELRALFALGTLAEQSCSVFFHVHQGFFALFLSTPDVLQVPCSAWP